MRLTVSIVLLAVASGLAVAQASEGNAIFLSDEPNLLLSVDQGWGELGLDTAAHAAGTKPLPLKIKGQPFAKGLGHHAPGTISVALDRQFSRFEAKVGVQQQDGTAGSVVFKVYVDDKLAFQSGVMRQTDGAQAVSLPVAGVDELRLVVEDGADGIACDVANWAEAVLVRDESASMQEFVPLDAGQFGQIITCDPDRMEGARAGRTEEYFPDDIYLEQAVTRHAAGKYVAPVDADGRSCLGIRWLEARRVQEVRVRLAEPYRDRDLERARLEYWDGPTLWQGRWQPLPGQSQVRQGMRIHHVEPVNASLVHGTRKVRIVFPASSQPAVVETLAALSPTALTPVELVASLESPASTGPVEVLVHNGKVVDASQSHEDTALTGWCGREPLEMRLLSSRPRRWTGDQTILRFHVPGKDPVAVAVADVMTHGCVYVPHVGLFVRLKDNDLSVEAYKQQIASRETILDQTRRLPDQTFEQAMEKVHHAKQDSGPMLLSLACDNRKFVAQREGEVARVALPETDDGTTVEFKTTSRIVPTFGTGGRQQRIRRLEGGWLPIPIVEVQEGEVFYTQKTYVAPVEQGRQSLCVVEYRIENRGSVPADALLTIRALASDAAEDLADVDNLEGVAVAHRGGRLIARYAVEDPGPRLTMATDRGTVTLGGPLAAGEAVQISGLLPHGDVPVEQHETLSRASIADLHQATLEHWSQATAAAMQIELPDPLLVNVIRASQVHCLLAARNESDGARIAPWISSDRYGPLESEANSILRGMDYLGYDEFSRRSLDFFVARYNKAGYLTTGYTMMGTGWHLWMLGEHFALVKDKPWLAERAPEVMRVCQWIIAQRAKTREGCADEGTCPERGLMPPGVMADWNNYAYSFCLNGYYYAGLKAAAEALREIEYPGAQELLDEATRFRADILRAYAWTQSRMPVMGLRDGTFVSGYPSQVHCPAPVGDFFPGQDGNRSWAYDVELGAHHLVPLGVLDVTRPDVASMMEHMEDVHFLAEGWFDYPAAESQRDPFNRGGFSKVQPYYSRNVEAYALRDEIKPFIRSYFNTIPSLLNREVLSFWEHFNGVGGWNKTHETGYFLHQTRLMLVQERGDELWLAPFVTRNWLKQGMKVSVERVPTRFGHFGYRIESFAKEGHIDVVIDPPTRNPVARLVVRLRHPDGRPMQRVTVNGVEHADFDAAAEVIRLESGAEQLRVRAYYESDLGQRRSQARDIRGLVSIFNGRDLAGWEGEPGWWRVVDGAITAESTADKPCTKHTYLIWRGGEPGDFELRLEYRLTGGNSGIQFRSREVPTWDTNGYQADMDGAGEWTGALYEHTRGGIALRGERVLVDTDGTRHVTKLGDPAELLKKVKFNDWNDYRIVAKGERIALEINGVLMAEAIDHQCGQAARSGVIALQMHPGPPMKVQFRKVRIRTDDPKPQDNGEDSRSAKVK